MTGEVTAGQLAMRTGWADYDVIWVSEVFRDEKIVGVWEFRNYSGVETKGTFRADQ